MLPKNLKRVSRNLDLLKIVGKCKKNMRENIIKSGSRDFIECICECVDNLLKKNIKLSDKELEKLHKYKCCLRKIVKKSSLKEKKRLINQKGGFLQFLIPAAVSVISGLISNAITSK